MLQVISQHVIPLTHRLRQFRELFEHNAGGKEAGEQLLKLRQGKAAAADYSLTFRTLAAHTGWYNGPLKLLYRKGLSTDLQTELACQDEGSKLEQFFVRTIRLDNLLCSRHPSRHSPIQMPTFAMAPEPEPMHVGVTRLS